MGLEMAYQALLIFSHAEKIVFFLDIGRLLLVVRTLALHQLFFGVKTLTAKTIMAPVLSEVDVPRIVDLLQNLPHDFLVVGIRSSDKMIVGDSASVPSRAKDRADAVGVGLRLHAVFPSSLGNLVAVLVRPGKKERLFPLLLVVTLERIGDYRRIGMAQVGLRVDVIDWSREINALGHCSLTT